MTGARSASLETTAASPTLLGFSSGLTHRGGGMSETDSTRDKLIEVGSNKLLNIMSVDENGLGYDQRYQPLRHI